MPPVSRRALLLASSFAVLPRGFAADDASRTLRRGNRYEPATLDPHLVNTSYELAIVGDLFEGLVTYNAAGEPVPGVAAAWTLSPDGKRYTFTLRPDLMWSDGTVLTAEDAVFSFRRLMNPKTAATFAALLYVLANGRAVNTGTMPAEALGVSAPNTMTVVMDLNAPAPYFPQLLASAYASLVPRAAISQHGDAWTRPGNMVCNGAFMLESWQPQNRIVLAHNPRFHAAAEVKLARVAYVPTADLNSGLARFKAGELDMQLDLPLSQIPALRMDMPVETRLTPTLLTYYLALNTTLPKLSDPRVRRALSLAIDREILTSKVLRGGEVPAFSFVPPMVAGYEPAALDFAAKPSEARVVEARELLAAAGYGTNNPLRIVYNHSANLDLRRIAVVIAGMWKRVGVEATLLNLEGKVHFANLRQGNFEAAFVGWAADFNDASSFLYVLDSGTTASNYSRYRNPAFDTYLARAASLENVAGRAALLRQAEDLVLKDQPIIPLYFGVTKSLVSQRVIGWRANPVDVHLSRYLSLAS